MLVKHTTWATLLLAASHTTAQTFSLCDPTKKTCPDNPALPSTTYTHDFVADGPDDATWNTTAGNVTYTPSGALFTISQAGEAPTIQSNWYIFFGRVSFILKSSPGTGIVSSAILESDTLDEIDLEWLGGADKVSEVQSNYFGKGNTTSFDRGEFHKADATQTVARNYTISWKSDATTWYIDSVPVRTLKFEDAVGGKNYPQTPMNIRIGNWAGGSPGNDKGTIEWAGGVTDFSQAPFTMVLEKVEVVNENPGVSYTYGDMSGGFESVRVNGGNASEVPVGAPSVAPSAAPAPAPEEGSGEALKGDESGKASSEAAERGVESKTSATPVTTAAVAETQTGTLATITSASVSAGGSESVDTPTTAAAETQPAAASALAEQGALKPSAVGLAAKLDVCAWWYVLLGAIITARLL